MRFNWAIIRLLLAVLALGFLYGFGSKRNDSRKLRGLEVHFTDENPPFITLDSVNKLLIQNADTVTSIVKETLVLREVEKRLRDNQMIRNAELFITVDGTLRAEIEQRNPVARVEASPDFYLDEEGVKMPLSEVYTERVPIITGQFRDSAALAVLLHRIENDPYMKSAVIGLHVENEDQVLFFLRKHGMRVRFGKPGDIDRKFRNFKAFYKKVLEDSLIHEYRLADLRFGNQVVAEKK